MTKTDLVKAVATKAEVSQKVAKEVIDAFADVVTDSVVAGEDVVIQGFVSFKVKTLKAKDGVVPGTEKEYHADERKTVKAYVAKNIKDAVRE